MIIISCVLNSDRLKKILAFPPIHLLGKVSYGMYLCHTIIMVFFTPLLLRALNNAGFTNWPILTAMAAIFTIGGTVALSYILYKCVEIPFIKLGKKVTSAMRAKNAVSKTVLQPVEL
jgi:exopolysaccharide production protein ExoZ